MSEPAAKESSGDRPSWILQPFFILAFLALALVPWFGTPELHIALKVVFSAITLAIAFGFYYMLWIRDPEKDMPELPRWLEPFAWVLMLF